MFTTCSDFAQAVVEVGVFNAMIRRMNDGRQSSKQKKSNKKHVGVNIYTRRKNFFILRSYFCYIFIILSNISQNSDSDENMEIN